MINLCNLEFTVRIIPSVTGWITAQAAARHAPNNLFQRVCDTKGVSWEILRRGGGIGGAVDCLTL